MLTRLESNNIGRLLLLPLFYIALGVVMVGYKAFSVYDVTHGKVFMAGLGLVSLLELLRPSQIDLMAPAYSTSGRVAATLIHGFAWTCYALATSKVILMASQAFA